jgi:FkbM family methyltransferase
MIMIKKVVHAVNSCASVSSVTAKPYLYLLSTISRWVDRPNFTRRVVSSLSGISWPMVEFRPRNVRVGDVEILLYPHFGEIGIESLFAKTWGYEPSSYRWIEAHASDFDAVIEIGANIGVFTVFFDYLARRAGVRLKQIYAFEPAPLNFASLRSNMLANQCSRIMAFNVAVGERGGFLPFYEPLMNLDQSSLNRLFVARWSEDFQERLVPAIAAADLEVLFRLHDRVLLKLDVETYEPQLISALASILDRYRPAVMIEVLKSTAEALDAAPWPPNYRAYLLDEHLTEHPHFFAHPTYRDWLSLPS